MSPRGGRCSSLVVVILTVLGIAAPRMASAHATLASCNLAPHAVVAMAPRTLSCTFAEGVSPRGSLIHVFEAGGDHAQVDLGNPEVSFANAKQITVGLPKLGSGSYTVLWYTISADDGHRAGGWFAFSVRQSP